MTFYGVHPKRGTEAMDAFGIIGACRQWVVHDHWKPYFSYQECLHALCNQHLLRELKFLWEEQQEGVGAAVERFAPGTAPTTAKARRVERTPI